MTRTFIDRLLSLVLAALSIPAAWGDTVAPSTKTNRPSTGIAAMPKKAFGFVVGTAVGMPVSLVRRIVDEDKEGIKGMVGDTDNKFSRVTAGSFWLPFSMLLGACEAPVYGPLNSLSNINKPFSKEQLGLGDHLMWAKESKDSSTTGTTAGTTAGENSASPDTSGGADTGNGR